MIINNVAFVSPEAKKNSAHEFSIHTVLCTVNRLLAEQRARVDFKKPWDFIFEFKEKIGFGQGILEYKKAPEGRDSAFLFANLGD